MQTEREREKKEKRKLFTNSLIKDAYVIDMSESPVVI